MCAKSSAAVVEVAEERVRGQLVLRRRRDGDRILDPDRRLRDHVRERLVVLVREDRLVLVGEQHVTAAGEASGAPRGRSCPARRCACRRRLRRYTTACACVFFLRSCAPYAAMMFHFAPPVCTFGVTTCTPGFTRSCQSRIFFGFPFRTAKTTTERVTMPCHLSFFQLQGDALVHELDTSGSSEAATTSALRPATTTHGPARPMRRSSARTTCPCPRRSSERRGSGLRRPRRAWSTRDERR